MAYFGSGVDIMGVDQQELISYATSGTPAVDIGDAIGNSMVLISGSSQYLSRTFTTSATWTCSFWLKRGRFTGTTMGLLDSHITLNSDDTITAQGLTTTAVFRDTAAWYHIHVSNNGLYINSVNYGAVTTAAITNPRFGYNGVAYGDCYITEFVFLDNTTSAYTNFGRISANTGAWVNKTYAGAYGAADSRLIFSNSSAMGADISGNGNNWTLNGGIGSANQYTDTPTNNFCVGDALAKYASDGSTFTVGNTKITGAGSIYGSMCSMGMPPNSGKFYWELTSSAASSIYPVFGLWDAADLPNSSGAFGGHSTFYGTYGNTGATYQAGVSVGTFSTVPNVAGTIINCAYDSATGHFWYGINGTWANSGNPGSGTGYVFTTAAGHTYVPMVTPNTSANLVVNFGQRPLSYSAPTNFVALSTANLVTPSILSGALHFDATTYTGTGASHSVSLAKGTFTPDLVWIRGRSGTTGNKLTDSVRGVTNGLVSNTTAAQTTDSNGVTALGAGAFTVGSDANYNTNAATYVAWAWKANGAAVSNTSGSITSSVSVNQAAGFSVLTFTGTGANATVGHGLGVAPDMVIVKDTGATDNWAVWHKSLTSGAYFMLLNTTVAQASGATYWNSTIPSSTVFSVGTASDTNASAHTYVAYCFATIPGYSAFGSYVGQGVAAGTYVQCGFRPRFVMVKAASTTGSWVIFDALRPGYNPEGGQVQADVTTAEATTVAVDIVSTGFKFRTASDPDAVLTYIYYAVAETPFKYADAR